MPELNEGVTVDTKAATVETNTRFDARDWKAFAEYICQMWKDRRNRRQYLQANWSEVDRQLRMDPDLYYKMKYDEHGNYAGRDRTKNWMPELEEPLQVQALEVLMADTNQLLFPSAGQAWFLAHANLTADYEARFNPGDVIEGLTNDPGSRVLQSDANALVQGAHMHFHNQYDHCEQWDRMDGECFKYGTLVGRVRSVKKRKMIMTSRGMVDASFQMPVVVARAIKNTYLDDRNWAHMNSGYMLSPSIIEQEYMRLEDIIIAARDGSTDPNDENGGWMPDAVKNIEPEDDGIVTVLDYEGDLVVERSSRDSIILPGAMTTVVMSGDKGQPVIVRHRWRQDPFLSYFWHSYQNQNADSRYGQWESETKTYYNPYPYMWRMSPYAIGPLMKGMPVQKAITELLNRGLQAAILNLEPPLGYDPEDGEWASTGGPEIYPRAMWPSLAGVKPAQIGDMGAVFAAYTMLLGKYADLMGVNPQRLGAPVVSHTTAASNRDALFRSTSRTVDYANSVKRGPMTDALYREFAIMKRVLSDQEQSIYVPQWRAWANVDADALPDDVNYEVHGAAGPLEEREQEQRMLQAAQFAIQLEAVDNAQRQEQGLPPRDRKLDIEAMQEEILRRGGWTDIDQFYRAAPPPAPSVPAAAPAGPNVQAGVLTSGAPSVALVG